MLFAGSDEKGLGDLYEPRRGRIDGLSDMGGVSVKRAVMPSMSHHVIANTIGKTAACTQTVTTTALNTMSVSPKTTMASCQTIMNLPGRPRYYAITSPISPTENVWDVIGRTLHTLLQNLLELREDMEVAWDGLSQDTIRNLYYVVLANMAARRYTERHYFSRWS
ncbi:hypothetical protein AOLI_G00249580 [Acnodon oligacanthus]